MNDYSEMQKAMAKIAENAIIKAVFDDIESYLPEGETIETASDEELQRALDQIKEELEEDEEVKK